jgi:hypothetical protein
VWLFVGIAEKNDSKAARPPADAPMPTIKNSSFTDFILFFNRKFLCEKS